MTTLQEAAMRQAIAALEESKRHLTDAMREAAIDRLCDALAQQVEQVCAGCGIPAGDVHMSTCKSGKWPSRVSNGDTAAPAPQAQDKSDNYLSGYCTGRTDLLKEQSAQPVAQPLAKTCDTCAHYQQGKHPGVSIHDETCYECRSYWGNKWEAA